MLQAMPKGPLQAVLMTAQPLKETGHDHSVSGLIEAMHKMQQMMMRHRYTAAALVCHCLPGVCPESAVA